MTSHKPVFTAYDNHAADSQNLPFFTNRDRANVYHGYFENVHGEQFVFVFDRETQQGTLWSGDCGWKTEIRMKEFSDLGVNLSPEELMWLGACWKAAKRLT
jgi:hypothetical protein